MSAAVQHSAADLRNELKGYVESEIAKYQSRIAIFQSEVEKFKAEIAKLSEVLHEDIDNRFKNVEQSKEIEGEEDTNEKVCDAEGESKETEEEIDSGIKNLKESKEMKGEEDTNEKDETEGSRDMYEKAFEQSGGEDALNQFKGMSNKLSNDIVDKIIEAEIEKLLPSSMPWNGVSKFLVNQSYVRSIDELYKNADKALVIFQRAIEVISAKTTPKAEAVIPPLKDKKRAEDKAKFKYSDEDGKGVAYYRLTDIVRATLEYEDLEKMYQGLEFVRKCKDFKIIEFNDRFQQPNPNAGGYRDLQLTVSLKANGFLCELQMSTKPMLSVKENYGHRDYEVYRRLKAAIQNRDIVQIESTLAFSQEQLGSEYKKNKVLPKICHELVHEAAIIGDADILDRLIEYGADVNSLDEDENTALHHTVFNGHERCVWLLLDKYNCERYLCNKDNETALMRGYIQHYTQPSEQSRRAIGTLIQKMDVKEVKKTSIEFQNILQSKLTKRRELADFAASGDEKKMGDLLRNFTDPNSERDGKSALQEAVRNGHTPAIELLMQFGVSVSPDILPTALEKGYEIAKCLISSSASRDDVLPTPHTIPCDVEGEWSGIACYGKKLFCAPYDASDILVIDAVAEKTHTIPCGVEGNFKWNGIACYGTKLFCAPYHASDILVIDAVTEETHTIPCGVKGSLKYMGIACCGTKLFCAPYLASDILVIDAVTEETHTIPCGVDCYWKWSGIACYGTKLFCAPYHASDILVIDAVTEETHTIPCGVEGKRKWSGIACYGTKLFCAPDHASDILVIDAVTEKTHTIPCGVEGEYKWSGISCYGTKLFCAPYHTSDILMIDAVTEKTYIIPCGVEGKYKGSGIACYGTKLFCAPSRASVILVLEDVMSSQIALQAAFEHRDYNTGNILVSRGAIPHVNVAPVRYSIPCDVEGEWSGIACYGTKLFCAPCDASDILVIDAETEETRTIPCGVKGKYKWMGIAWYGTKLFCAPYHTSDILVIDAETEETRTIPCGVEGKYKWSGIACYGTKLFCAPYHASDILVIDAVTEKTHTIPCGVDYYWKWSGIACYGKKLFCAPYDASDILVIDAVTEETHTIPCGVEGEYKWSGIACYGKKLFCAPCVASDILVIDAETEETHTIPCGIEGNFKWNGIACYGKKLFCAPSRASDILVIDAVTEQTYTIPCGVKGDFKWSGISCYGKKIFCAPRDASEILALEDPLGTMQELGYLTVDADP